MIHTESSISSSQSFINLLKEKMLSGWNNAFQHSRGFVLVLATFSILAVCVQPVQSQVYLLNENFGDGVGVTPPSGWVTEMLAGTSNDLWHFDNPGNRSYTFPFSTPFAVFDASAVSGGNGTEGSVLTSPQFNSSAASYCLLIFDHQFESGVGATAFVEFFNGISWVTVSTISSTTIPSEVHQIVDLTPISTTVTNAKIRFRWQGNGDGYWMVDNVKVLAALPVDAGIIAIDQPVAPFSQGIQTVGATLYNFGYQTLTSTTILWSVNGQLQPPVSWTGNLTTNLSQANIPLGNYNFLPNQTYSIRCWTQNPNGNPDPFNNNDTTGRILAPGLCGIVTLGDTNSTFASIDELNIYMTTAGISCATTINISEGSHAGALAINGVKGLSEINMLTIQSENGNPTTASLIGDVSIRSSGYITINNLTIIGRVLVSDSTHHLTINHNIITGVTSTYISFSGYSHHISIVNNEIQKAGVVAVLFENSVDYLNFENNSIIGIKSRGLLISGYSTYLKINRNVLKYRFLFDYPCIDVFCGYSEIKSNVINATGSGVSVIGGGGIVDISCNRIDSVASIGIHVSGKGLRIYNNQINMPADGDCGISFNADSSLCTFNTINMGNLGGNSTAVNVTGSMASLVLNNIFLNRRPEGFGVTISGTLSAALELDYNSYFCTRTGKYPNLTYDSLILWQVATGREQHGVEANPYFSDYPSLTPNHFLINDAGTAIQGITLDIDSTIRNSTYPDIGAKEFNVCENDAGIESLTSPSFPLTAGWHDLVVSLRNHGSIILSNVDIYWNDAGMPQPVYHWSGMLAPGESAIVNLGNFYFTPTEPHQISVWPANPNGLADCNNNNDIVSSGLFMPSLCGSYTVGGAAADFADINDAIDALELGGMSCAVELVVNDTIYDQPIRINQIPGSSVSNTLTIRSASNDSTKVYFSCERAPGTSSPGFQIFNAQYIKLKHLHIEDIQINGGSQITIENCYFSGPYWCVILNDITNANVLNNRIVAFHNYAHAITCNRVNQITISGNDISGGILFNSNSSKNALISENKVYSLFIAADSSIIENNEVCLFYKQSGGSIYSTAVEVFGTAIALMGNRVRALASHDAYIGYKFQGTNLKVVNNTFYGTGDYPVTGFFVEGAQIDLLHNSISINSLNTFSKALEIKTGTGRVVKNNIFSNHGKGIGIAKSDTIFTGDQFDYNCYFAASGILATINQNSFRTFNHWQQVSQGDSNSMAIDPQFITDSTLIPTHSVLNNSGVPVPGVAYDIDSVLRDPLHPDIGAKEFALCDPDAGIDGVSGLPANFSSGTYPVRVTLRNHGNSPLHSVDVTLIVDDIPLLLINWTGNLLPGDTAVLSGGLHYFSASIHRICAYTDQPNNLTDCNPANDSCHLHAYYPLLCGNFYVGGSTPNFSSLDEVAEVLNNSQVSCAVNFLFREGDYPGQVELSHVIRSNTQPEARIRFMSDPANSGPVRFIENPSASSYYSGIIQLKNVSGLSFINTEFYNTNFNRHGLLLNNSTDDSVILCNFRTISYSAYNSSYGITGPNITNLVVDSCCFYGNGKGIYTNRN